MLQSRDWIPLETDGNTNAERSPGRDKRWGEEKTSSSQRNTCTAESLASVGQTGVVTRRIKTESRPTWPTVDREERFREGGRAREGIELHSQEAEMQNQKDRVGSSGNKDALASIVKQAHRE